MVVFHGYQLHPDSYRVFVFPYQIHSYSYYNSSKPVPLGAERGSGPNEAGNFAIPTHYEEARVIITTFRARGGRSGGNHALRLTRRVRISWE